MMTHALPDLLHRRRFDVNDLMRMAAANVFGEDERLELFDGELVEMPPQPGPRHCGEVNALTRLFTERCGGRCLVAVQNPLQLDDHNLFVPDLVLLRAEPGFYRDRYPLAADTLLVVEVAETTLARDRRAKVPRYARCGVPQVWIIDLRARIVHAFASPAADGYATVRQCKGDDALAIPEDGEVTVAELLG